VLSSEWVRFALARDVKLGGGTACFLSKTMQFRAESCIGGWGGRRKGRFVLRRRARNVARCWFLWRSVVGGAEHQGTRAPRLERGIGFSVRISSLHLKGRRCAFGTLRAQQKRKRSIFSRILQVIFLLFDLREVRARERRSGGLRKFWRCRRESTRAGPGGVRGVRCVDQRLQLGPEWPDER
jgi:hypothetical protein